MEKGAQLFFSWLLDMLANLNENFRHYYKTHFDHVPFISQPWRRREITGREYSKSHHLLVPYSVHLL